MIASFAVSDRASAVRIPVGRCVYCGSENYRSKDDRRLGDEHVIPESLGGNLILDQAACESCERRVNLFEQAILKTVLYAPRVFMGIRRKKRKRGAEHITVSAKVNGNDVKITLPVARMPAMLFFVTMGSPGLLIGRPPDIGAMDGAWVKPFFENGPRVPAGLESMASPILDTFKFMQFLAKIAHCYAVGALGSTFTPLLPELILSDPKPPNYSLIGGNGNSAAEPPTGNLHELSLNWQSYEGVEYAMVSIRMFANLGAPTYRVIAGHR